MKLRSGQLCPIHHMRDCCGRHLKEIRIKSKTQRKGPVTRIPDEHHPRGYRELCTPAEMRRRLGIKLQRQGAICAICGLPIIDFREASNDHIGPRGMGGARRDDHLDNLQAVHNSCNLAKGSQRNYQLRTS